MDHSEAGKRWAMQMPAGCLPLEGESTTGRIRLVAAPLMQQQL
jgi:hypothetical protein